MPNNSDSVKVLSRKEASRILEGVTSKPTIDVGSIYHRFMELQSPSNVAYDDARTLTLMRLFYAIASPDTICQLRDVCHSTQEGAFQVMKSTEDVRGDMEALDRLDTSDHVVSMAERTDTAQNQRPAGDKVAADGNWKWLLCISDVVWLYCLKGDSDRGKARQDSGHKVAAG